MIILSIIKIKENELKNQIYQRHKKYASIISAQIRNNETPGNFYNLVQNNNHMKKIICILVALMVMGTGTFAQKKSDKTNQDAKPATTKASDTKKKDDKAGDTKATKTKKDGTADMRYKENKEAAKPAPKLKKDGTPDMRYKENKDAAKKADKKK